MKTFLEIGTSYFDTLNYLADRGWQGIQLEPIKKYQDKIERKENVHYENSAIYYKNTDKLEMVIAPDEIVAKDQDFAGMSSIVRKNGKYLTEKVLVNGITFETLFEKYDVKAVDLLKVDVEGYDWQVLSLFPYHILKPKYIQAECKHWSGEHKPYMKALLVGHGYHVTLDYENLYAILI